MDGHAGGAEIGCTGIRLAHERIWYMDVDGVHHTASRLTDIGKSSIYILYHIDFELVLWFDHKRGTMFYWGFSVKIEENNII